MPKTDFIPRPKGKFLRVRCSGCNNEQTIYSRASSKVNCLVCNQSLGQTSASKIKLNTKVLQEFE